MTLGTKALQVLKTVAPIIGTAIGGPFGAIAGTLLSKALGSDPADDKSAETALLAATPEQLLAVKKAENDFNVQMQQLGVQEEQLQYADVASARARDAAVKDWVPAALSVLITSGFFGVLSYMLVNGTPKLAGGEAFLVMLGSLGTAWTAVVGFYFGSSVGAQKNAETIAQIAKQP
jgi:hypothetical protein